MMRSAAAAAALLLAVACREPAGAERLGDRAYAAGDYAGAYSAYADAAGPDAPADLLAKLGLAALRQNDAAAALDAYRRLAAAAPDRAEEAAEGMATAAGIAASRGDAATLGAAVSALRKVAPERAAGRWVLDLARRGELSDAELLALAPLAVAVAPDPESADSIIVSWADALVAADSCAAAGSLYRAVGRRSRVAQLAAAGRSGAAACALAAARASLRARDTAAALDALGSVEGWADSDDDAAAAAALAAELRAAAERLPPMDTAFLDTTFFMEDR